MFATKLFEMLGVKGITVIVFVIIMGIQGVMIYKYKSNINKMGKAIETHKTTIVTLNGQIDLQNQAVSKFEIDKKTAEEALQTAKKKIADLDAKNAEYKKRLGNLPLATSCVGAITELKSQSSIQVQGWNK